MRLIFILVTLYLPLSTLAKSGNPFLENYKKWYKAHGDKTFYNYEEAQEDIKEYKLPKYIFPFRDIFYNGDRHCFDMRFNPPMVVYLNGPNFWSECAYSDCFTYVAGSFESYLSKIKEFEDDSDLWFKNFEGKQGEKNRKKFSESLKGDPVYPWPPIKFQENPIIWGKKEALKASKVFYALEYMEMKRAPADSWSDKGLQDKEVRLKLGVHISHTNHLVVYGELKSLCSVSTDIHVEEKLFDAMKKIPQLNFQKSIVYKTIELKEGEHFGESLKNKPDITDRETVKSYYHWIIPSAYVIFDFGPDDDYDFEESNEALNALPKDIETMPCFTFGDSLFIHPELYEILKPHLKGEIIKKVERK